ncbi:MAG: DUF2029 domain-containing protein [Deltaproteobacteria bacterium]|nr:DUF2029 domain-containing protein [Deltaproteobacteria bacterium]
MSLQIVRQAFLLTIVTWLMVVPRLSSEGINIVTRTYEAGANRFWANENPYRLPIEGGDRYEYSPFFAMFYRLFTLLGGQAQALLWAAFNLAVFWLGISCWCRLERASPWWLILTMIAASMELNGSVLYQQINACIVGMTLTALWLFQKKNFFWAGLLITIATNIKPLPGIFALALLFPIQIRYWLGLFAGSAITLLVPALIVGFSNDYFFHLRWFETLGETLRLVRPGQLDIASAIEQLGFPTLGRFAQLGVATISLVLLFNPKKEKQWGTWCSLGLCAILLVSSRSESPSYVLLAPTYVFIGQEIAAHKGRFRWPFAILLLSGVFFATICFNDLWPKWLWNPHARSNLSKTLGASLVWLTAVGLTTRKAGTRPKLEDFA